MKEIWQIHLLSLMQTIQIREKYKEQIRIVKEVLHSRLVSKDIQNLVKGVMIESYLVEGCQKSLLTIFTENLLQIHVLDGKILKSLSLPLPSFEKKKRGQSPLFIF